MSSLARLFRINRLGAFVAGALIAGCGGGGSSPSPAPTPPPAADVRVVASTAVARVLDGGRAAYAMTVSNAGPVAAANVVLSATLSAGQALGAVTCTASGGATCPASLGATMTVPALPTGGALVFQMPATLDRTGAARDVNLTLAAAAVGDTQAGNNSATSSLRVTLPNRITLTSEAGDFIGQGRSYQYDSRSALIRVTASGNRAGLSVLGDENWTGEFQLPSAFGQVQTGSFANLTRYPFHAPAVGGLSWSGEGRGCNQLHGSMTINRAEYFNGQLDELELSFVQYCENSAAALRGELRWSSADDTRPAGPTATPVAWQPPAGATPSQGSYVYLESESGDFIGGGSTYLYTRANALLVFSGVGGRVDVTVDGNENWRGEFQAMLGLTQLQPGYYGSLQRYPFHNAARGGLSWAGQGRGCNRLTGWFVVDEVTYNGTDLVSLELRFEQRCDGAAAALRGKLRLVQNDTNTPPGPTSPPPAGLWTPPAGATPASGNFVYLQSDAGDFIGGGQTYLYQAPATPINITTGTGRLQVDVAGWSGQFQAMQALARLQPGYYGNLQRYPFHNPVAGGLSWSGQGRGCNRLRGWFVVDRVSYDISGLQSIELRFQQRCEEGTTALYGALRWSR